MDKLLALTNVFECGNIDESCFRDRLRAIFQLSNIDDIELDSIWNSMLVSLNLDAYEFVNELSQNFNLALLSNTNSIHSRKFRPEISNIEPLFKDIFYSYIIGITKPDYKIYNYVCNNCGFVKEETLFIDDNLDNINGAISANLQVFHFTRNGKLSDLFNTIKNIAQT